jgi:hypothetical protein
LRSQSNSAGDGGGPPQIRGLLLLRGCGFAHQFAADIRDRGAAVFRPVVLDMQTRQFSEVPTQRQEDQSLGVSRPVDVGRVEEALTEIEDVVVKVQQAAVDGARSCASRPRPKNSVRNIGGSLFWWLRFWPSMSRLRGERRLFRAKAPP